MSVYKLQGSHKPTADSSSFVGEVGDLFYNDTGTIRISDGQTPGGVRPDSIIESLLQLGITDGKLPTKAAVIHRIINAAPPKVRESLLKLFIGELFS